jgi:hypothetical protein
VRKEEAKKMKRTRRTAGKVTKGRAAKDGDDGRKEERTVEVVQAEKERESHIKKEEERSFLPFSCSFNSFHAKKA